MAVRIQLDEKRSVVFNPIFRRAETHRPDSDEFDHTADVPTHDENVLCRCGCAPSPEEEMMANQARSHDDDNDGGGEDLPVRVARITVAPINGDEAVVVAQVAKKIKKIRPPKKRAVDRKEQKKRADKDKVKTTVAKRLLASKPSQKERRESIRGKA